MRNFLLILVFIMLANISVFSNKIYTWVDQDGVTHFSDSNNRNEAATAISSTPQNIIRTSSDGSEPNENNNQQSQDSNTISLNDIKISIIKPISNETFQNNRSQPIAVTLSGYENIFTNNGYIELNVDNKINRTFTSGNNFYINSPDRGQHNLQAVAYDQNGKRITESQNVIFFIQDQTARNSAGSTTINNTVYQNQATPVNYSNFRRQHQDQLVSPTTYNNGFKPTSDAYIRQVTGQSGN